MHYTDQFDDYRNSMAKALDALRTARTVICENDFDAQLASGIVRALQLAEQILDTTDLQVQACLFGGIRNHAIRDTVAITLPEQILDFVHTYKVQSRENEVE